MRNEYSYPEPDGVENRVAEGGHGVPPEVIRRRFAAGIRNLFQLYRPILAELWLHDASRLPPRLIAIEKDGKLAIKRRRLFRWIEQQAEDSDEK